MFPSGRPGMNREGKGFANPFFFFFVHYFEKMGLY